MNGISVFSLLSIELYMLFIVYSQCEDLAAGGSGPDLSDLAALEQDNKPHMWRHRWWHHKMHAETYRGSLESNVMAGYGTVYDEAATASLGGSSQLFGFT